MILGTSGEVVLGLAWDQPYSICDVSIIGLQGCKALIQVSYDKSKRTDESMKVSKKVTMMGLAAVQLGFDFVAYARPAVLSVSRYCANGAERKGFSPGYAQWLEWASALNHSVNNGGVK